MASVEGHFVSSRNVKIDTLTIYLFLFQELCQNYKDTRGIERNTTGKGCVEPCSNGNKNTNFVALQRYLSANLPT